MASNLGIVDRRIEIEATTSPYSCHPVRGGGGGGRHFPVSFSTQRDHRYGWSARWNRMMIVVVVGIWYPKSRNANRYYGW
jgi:hypothetical protein